MANFYLGAVAGTVIAAVGWLRCEFKTKPPMNMDQLGRENVEVPGPC
jgi:hypothetical protein